MLSKPKASRETSAAGSKPPIRWDDLPHHQLFAEASQKLDFGSIFRSHEDAELFILRRCLPALVPAEHYRCTQLTAARILERLRSIRHTYLIHLESKGCKPLSELRWVVFRFGVTDWAVMLLRSAVIDYVSNAQIEAAAWESLFFPYIYRQRQDKERILPEPTRQKLHKSVEGLLPRHCFNQVLTGGPFDRLGQKILALKAAPIFTMSGQTLPEIIRDREDLWDACKPWTEGLARLFDAVQAELMLQRDLLGVTAREQETAFKSLTPFEQIAYRHLRELRAGSDSDAPLGKKG